jgi:hypothetical protein
MLATITRKGWQKREAVLGALKTLDAPSAPQRLSSE